MNWNRRFRLLLFQYSTGGNTPVLLLRGLQSSKTIVKANQAFFNDKCIVLIITNWFEVINAVAQEQPVSFGRQSAGLTWRPVGQGLEPAVALAYCLGDVCKPRASCWEKTVFSPFCPPNVVGFSAALNDALPQYEAELIHAQQLVLIGGCWGPVHITFHTPVTAVRLNSTHQSHMDPMSWQVEKIRSPIRWADGCSDHSKRLYWIYFYSGGKFISKNPRHPSNSVNLVMKDTSNIVGHHC